MRRYLTLQEVLLIHEESIAVYGGASGLRDPGLLDSAVTRPQMGYYADEFEEAAALWESLSQNHPFVDGNKRTAIGSAEVFLILNGWELDYDPLEAYDFIINLYETGRMKFDVLAAWLREKARPISPESPE